MKPFRFQQFDIQQDKNVFRVGTDGVLLGALATINSAKTILEIGTGTGLISLMLAQRNPTAKITGIDINKEAYRLTSQNFEASPFNNRLQALHEDFKIFSSDKNFDLIISNPPYFEENTSTKDKLARQKIELEFDDLIEKASFLISDSGIFSVIIPAESTINFENTCRKNGFYLMKKINIKGIYGGNIKRAILEFSKQNNESQTSEFVIEESPRRYSEQYLEATKDFHIFKVN